MNYDDDDYEIDDLPFPACGNSTTHSCDCIECDEMNEEVICCDDICVGSGHCIHGDGMGPYRNCNGTGIQRWCPACGADYWDAVEARGNAQEQEL